MKHLPLLLLLGGLLSASAARSADPVRYVDAATLTVIGKALPTEQPYNRIDTTRFRVPAKTPGYCYHPTGLAVVFRTDSRNIRARWTTVNQLPGANSTLIAQRGLDLYIRRDGKWVFAGVGVPSKSGTQHEAPVVEHMDTTMKECLLYLPLHDEIAALEIGTDEGALLEAAPDPFRHRIVVIGSSITHGTSASRPGMAYAARLGRPLGFGFINLGASGQCKLDTFFARIAAETRADAFLFDAFSNPSPKMIRERLDAFVATLVKAHPDKPLIFMQTHWHAAGNFNNEAAQFHRERIATADRMMRRLAKQYDNVYFLDGEWYYGKDSEGTIDCDHGSDLGFDRMIR